jgi:hypothetical protein
MNIDSLITGNPTNKRGAKPKKAAPSTTAPRKRRRDEGTIGGIGSKSDNNNSSSSNHDNDDDLLAIALGSSSSGIRDADQYEESVLRDAELSNTPRLMVTRANESVKFGFPSLEGLVPSRSVHADLGHVRNVLRQLRKGNGSSGNGNRPPSALLTKTKECLKEQMLLALMQSASGDPEMGVFPQQEAKQEWKRRKMFREGKGDGSDSNKINDKRVGTNSNKTNGTQQASGKDGKNANADNDVSLLNDETPEGRLEGIKKGGSAKKKSVRFSSDVKSANPSIPRSLLSKKVVRVKPKAVRRRISIQERRRLQEGGPSDGEMHVPDEDEISRDRIIEQLKQLRIEREERRKQRKQAWRDNNDIGDGDDDDSDSEGEFEFTGEEENKGQPSSVPVDDSLSEATSSSLPIPDAPSSAAPATATADNNIHSNDNSLVCPLCGEEIPLPETTMSIITENGSQAVEEQRKSHRDAILAQHISVCQSQRRSRRGRRGDALASTPTTRGSPTQSRRDSRRASRPNYTEAESDGETEISPASTSSRQPGWTDSHTEFDNDDDDGSVYGANEGIQGEIEEDELIDDGIVMDEDDREIITGKATRSKARARRPNRTKPTRKIRRAPGNHPSRRSRPPPLDDWYEEDYEDRVDEWIEHGLEKMPMMQERDADEIAPGEEEFEGGLIVPAWTNDRLFPYQRTGLQWMWELHRQQSGGILGDEMVRVMYFR